MRILPNIPGSRCVEICDEGPRILLHFVRTVPTVQCPGCQQPAHRVQSGYRRTVSDIPWRGFRVQVQLEVRRFWCSTPTCAYQVFCERLDPWVPAYGRRSAELTAWIQQWGWHLSAEALARVALDQGCDVSATTILRILRMAVDPSREAPRVVGIDDWAIRKGHTYATVVVDQERHRIIEILPDRGIETVTRWLQQHPGIEVVSRDRARGYGKAISDGAPQARQVADRWHLLKNLSDAFNELLTRTPPPRPRSPALPLTHHLPSTPKGVVHQQERYAAVKALAHGGYRVAEIARQTGLDRKTVTKYLSTSTPPDEAPRAPYPHLLDPFVSQLERLWVQGIRQALPILETLQTAGYHGSLTTISRWLRQRRAQERGRATPPVRIARRTWATWFLGSDTSWPRQATVALTQLMTDVPEYRRAWTLVHLFHTMLTHRKGSALAAWIRAAQVSGIPELMRFAKGLAEDAPAVQAGLTDPWSQGMTEGFNNQIKCLKRIMYGRAHLDLLRARILHNQR